MVSATVLEDLQRFGPGQALDRPPSLLESRAYCRQLARTHYENFLVGTLLLPRRLRQHFYHIYAFCRWADDLADEPNNPVESTRLLGWWSEQLDECYAARASHPVFVALRETIDEFDIPQEPFQALLSAFQQDQHVRRYDDFDELRDYCRRSADPVGKLILYLGRCHDRRRAELSAAICTGLQLANFCQDVARDWDRGRVYLPQDTLAREACDESAFIERRATRGFRRALEFEVARAESWLLRGLPLVELVPRELQLDVWLFARGGLCILQRIRQLDYDVWTMRPKVSKWDQLRLMAQGLWQTRRPRGRHSLAVVDEVAT